VGTLTAVTTRNLTQTPSSPSDQSQWPTEPSAFTRDGRILAVARLELGTRLGADLNSRWYRRFTVQRGLARKPTSRCRCLHPEPDLDARKPYLSNYYNSWRAVSSASIVDPEGVQPSLPLPVSEGSLRGVRSRLMRQRGTPRVGYATTSLSIPQGPTRRPGIGALGTDGWDSLVARAPRGAARIEGRVG
jgi:hypothetical protein